MNKQEEHIVQGLTRDISKSQFNDKYVYDAHNIRITTNNGNPTTLSVTNEKGTLNMNITGITGTVIGYAVFSDHIVIFTTTNTDVSPVYNSSFTGDHIYDITIGDTVSTSLLFSGCLKFSTKNPIETIPMYETESIQKVYWTDGYNQPRMIKLGETSYTDGDFDFSQNINLSHTINVTKHNMGGKFTPGTIQYAFAYYNKFRQQTHIFDCTPLYYLSLKERGLKADSFADCSFEIKINNLDLSYDYLRVYSIERTTANATPVCRIVGDYRITAIDSVLTFYHIGYIQLSQRFDSSYKGLTIIDSSFNKIKNLTDETPISTNSEYSLYKITPGTGYLFDTVTGKAFKTGKNISIICNLSGRMYNVIPTETINNEEVNSGTIDYGDISSLGKDFITIIDNGITGETVDASDILFSGSEEITASTIAQKDNTLFLGNIKETMPDIGSLSLSGTKLYNWFHNNISNLSQINIDYNGIIDGNTINPSGETFYDYTPDNNRSSRQIKRFKYGENYRLGIIAQYKTGKWSEAVWIDDADQLIKPEMNNHQYLTGGWKYTVPSTVVNLLIANGYKRIAPVVVYPTTPDRRVICQGILCPTVYNVKDRSQNSPFVQSDWGFHFYGMLSDNYSLGSTLDNDGCDIQCMQDVKMYAPYAKKKKTGDVSESYMTNNEFIDYFSEDYFIDTNTMTFHSPDIECSEELLQSNFDDVKLRITGFSRTSVPSLFYQNISKASYDWLCELNNLGINTNHSKFIKNNVNNKALPCYSDSYVKIGSASNEEPHEDSIFGWFVYPWHRNGSLNNQSIPTTDMTKNGYTRTAVLKKKIISSLYYGLTDYDYITNSITGNDLNSNPQGISITIPQLFNSEEMSAIKIPSPANSGLGSLTYYGNVDKVIIPNLVNMSDLTLYLPAPTIQSGTTYDTHAGIDKSLGYPILYGWKKYIGSSVPSNVDTTNYYKSEESLVKSWTTPSNVEKFWNGTAWEGGTEDDISYNPSYGFFGKDPIPMKYKVSPHLVFSFDYSINKEIKVLPMIKNIDVLKDFYIKQYDHSPFWMDTDKDISDNSYTPFKVSPYNIGRASTYINSTDELIGLYVGDLYRTFSSDQMETRFGGRTYEAFTNNEWIVCGNPVMLYSDTSAEIDFKEGDTYLERYDCLKTYPFSNNEINSIVSIYSTDIETRVNLDERYDRNKGLQSNLQITPEIFNLYNHTGYEQDNNFFNYHGIDYDRFTDLNFPNIVAWSMQKTLGEDIDSWTDIDMTSTIDLDGNKGMITALKQWNNNLYAFQEKGLSQLLFNSRVQIPTSDNVPIEITNGMKMEGKRYISNIIGCTNKYSITETESGLYFIDNDSGSLYRYGEQLENLSLKEGMKSWFDSNKSDTIHIYYDKVNMDLYIIDTDWCLVYSEQFSKFISFMDYNNSSVLFNMGKNCYIIKNNSSNVELWKMFSGNYNSFFGVKKPYWMTFVSNSNPTYDKVFNNIDYRATLYNNNIALPDLTFDYLRVWTDTQDTGDVTLSPVGLIPNLQKKFNVWRIAVPRDKDNTLDRIRNTSAYIKLGVYNENTLGDNRMQFMDAIVNYFI